VPAVLRRRLGEDPDDGPAPGVPADPLAEAHLGRGPPRSEGVRPCPAPPSHAGTGSRATAGRACTRRARTPGSGGSRRPRSPSGSENRSVAARGRRG
jgi:hypothetical protein